MSGYNTGYGGLPCGRTLMEDTQDPVTGLHNSSLGWLLKLMACVMLAVLSLAVAVSVSVSV